MARNTSGRAPSAGNSFIASAPAVSRRPCSQPAASITQGSVGYYAVAATSRFALLATTAGVSPGL